MNIPHNLPITPLQSKAARYQLGLTQANVIGESDLPGHKLKSFETGRFIPDMKFLQSLQAYYEGKGINLSDLKTDDQASPVAAPVKPRPGASTVQPAYGMVFRVSDAISEDQVNALLGQMDGNDERIAAILNEPAKAGFLSAFDERTEALQRELFGLMAANYQIFRTLQGRVLTDPPSKNGEVKTQADLLAQWIAAGPMASLLLASSATPKAAAMANDLPTDLEENEEEAA